MARPLKLTPECADTLFEAIKMGMSIRGACNCAGIDEDTYFAWLKRGQTGEEPFAGFSERAREARGEGEKALVTGMTTDTGRIFILRSSFGYKDGPLEVKHSGRVELEGMSAEVLAERARQIAESIAEELAKTP